MVQICERFCTFSRQLDDFQSAQKGVLKRKHLLTLRSRIRWKSAADPSGNRALYVSAIASIGDNIT